MVLVLFDYQFALFFWIIVFEMALLAQRWYK